MKKKIGIVTIHTDFNYGAVLQAYATEKFIELNGYDVEIIDYENPHISEQSKLVYKQGNKIRGYLITLVRNTIFGRYRYFKMATKDLDLWRKKSNRKYSSLGDLSETDYDVLIAGSDQIWNPEISQGLDPAFFLQFGNPQKRISVATSLGSYVLKDSEKKYVQTALNTFSDISVREKFAKTQIIGLVNKDVKVLLDPTFLLSKKEWWETLAKNSKYAEIKSKYILTYFVGSNKGKYRSSVADYAGKLNLPVWTIQYSNYTWKESTKKILGASIVDFVALIGNAALVITDSYHGVAFSVNMEKNFVALTNDANPVRVRELLQTLNLEERMDMDPKKHSEIDYSKVSPIVNSLRIDSANWVLNALKE